MKTERVTPVDGTGRTAAHGRRQTARVRRPLPLVGRLAAPKLRDMARASVASVVSALLLLVCTDARTACASEVVLKNGLVIKGTPVKIQSLDPAHRSAAELPTYRLYLITNGMQRYFVHERNVAEVRLEAELSRFERFELTQKRIRTGRPLAVVGSVLEATPFDEFGRRTVKIRTPQGDWSVIQGITELRPQFVKVTALNEQWEFGMATTSIPPQTLRKILHRAIDPKNPDERLAVARFLIQATWYTAGLKELDAIAAEFPELAGRIEELRRTARQLIARQLLIELRHRRQAGQHRLAHLAAAQFPREGLNAELLSEVEETLQEYAALRERLHLAVARLGELQALLPDKSLRERLEPLRGAIREQLDFESLPRLGAFLKLHSDETLEPAGRLALAYSGWIVGAENAVTDLNAALRLWDAQFLVRQVLNESDPGIRAQLAARLSQLEGIGPEVLRRIVEHLPPWKETAFRPTAGAFDVTVDLEEGGTVTYSVLLPLEYNPFHRYPMIVALRPAQRTRAEELAWWGGTAQNPLQSQRRGYIVIAPEYLEEGQRSYQYDAFAHRAVLTALTDACRRFHVDSDRVFLAGHAAGGDAAFDIGMAHPDLFAGVIPIAGVIDRHAKFLWKNGRRVAWYVVSGELDRDTFQRNAFVLNQMLKHGFEMIFTEYIGRGYESFYEEIHKLFDWMDRQRRERFFTDPDDRTVDVSVLRPHDDQYYWITLHGVPASVVQSPVNGGSGRQNRPMTLQVRITEGNTIYLRSGADRHTLWLAPEMIDFQQRVRVRAGGRTVFNGFLQPDISVLLEDVRRRADRRKLFFARIDL